MSCHMAYTGLIGGCSSATIESLLTMHPFLALISTFSDDNKARGAHFPKTAGGSQKLCETF